MAPLWPSRTRGCTVASAASSFTFFSLLEVFRGAPFSALHEMRRLSLYYLMFSLPGVTLLPLPLLLKWPVWVNLCHHSWFPSNLEVALTFLFHCTFPHHHCRIFQQCAAQLLHSLNGFVVRAMASQALFSRSNIKWFSSSNHRDHMHLTTWGQSECALRCSDRFQEVVWVITTFFMNMVTEYGLRPHYWPPALVLCKGKFAREVVVLRCPTSAGVTIKSQTRDKNKLFL